MPGFRPRSTVCRHMPISSTLPPTHLYKFRSLAGEHRDFTRDIIEKSRLFWPPPASFNDPFDCTPVVVMEGSRLKRESYIRRILRNYAADWPKSKRKHLIRTGVSRSSRAYELSFTQQQKQMRHEIGVCSFSERWDHPLMWAHYADAHRGICLRFSVPQSGGYFELAFPVTYSARRPIINVVEKHPDELLEQVILTKADFWGYEREWRLLDQDSGPGLHPFPASALDGVIFGVETSQSDMNDIAALADAFANPIQLLKASIDDRLFELRSNSWIPAKP